MAAPQIPSDDVMRAFLLRFIQDVKHKEGVTVPSENQRDFIILFGLIQRVRRLANAYLRLARLDFGSEASILARAALEHAVTAQWAYLTPGGIDRLNVTLARAQADLVGGMVAYSEDPEWPARAAELRAGIPDGPALPKFTGPEGIMAELDSVRFLSVSYRVLSQVGHVTHQAALDFVVQIDDQIELRTDPEEEERREVLYALSGFCMLVAWIHARLEADEEEINRLKEISVALSVPWRLDSHLPRHRRRFPDEDGPGD